MSLMLMGRDVQFFVLSCASARHAPAEACRGVAGAILLDSDC
jgi:hypothetical protein